MSDRYLRTLPMCSAAALLELFGLMEALGVLSHRGPWENWWSSYWQKVPRGGQNVSEYIAKIGWCDYV